LAGATQALVLVVIYLFWGRWNL